MDSIIYFIGRFHPLIVHLPVALLPLAGIFWALSKYKKLKNLETTITHLLVVGSLAALGSVLSGFALASSGEYEEALLNKHRGLGILSTLIGLVALFFHVRPTNPKVLLALFTMLTILVGFTGHWGGMLTHGENWFAMEPTAKSSGALEKLKAISIDSTSNAQLYSDLVAPLLEAKCLSCHNAQKQKGELRLDTQQGITKGGKHGLIVDTSKPEKSELLVRIVKSIEEKGHMPPRQEEQLDNLEVELLKWWLKAGAPFNKTVAQAKAPALLLKLWQAKPVEGIINWLPEKSIEAINQAALDSLEKYGFRITTIGKGNNFLSITTAGERTINDRGWKQLSKLRENIVDFDASFSTLSDEAVTGIATLHQLRRLKLNNTTLTDENLKRFSAMAELRSLHVTNTRITSACVSDLKQLVNLKEIFVFGTALSNTTVDLPHVQLNRGNYTLPKLASDTIVYKVK